MTEKKNILDKYVPKQARPKLKDRGLAIIVGGDFETGKTFLSASFPDPIVIIDMDQGTEALWDQYDFVKQEEYKGLYPDKDIRVIEIRVDKELEDSDLDDDMSLDFDTGFVNAFINAREAVKTVTKALQAGADIGTVVFETASWLWAGAMDYMKYVVLQLDPTAKSYVDQQFDWFVAQKEYSKVFKQMIALRDYGTNVIITVHTKPTYTMKKVDGRSQRVKTGEEFQWWDKSFRMSPIVLHIERKSIEVSDGKFRMSRVTSFKRIRGVPNAGNLSQSIIDITYDKFVNELHMIRERYESIKATGKPIEEATTDAVEAVVTKKATTTRRRRRG
jgi:hypothetical protein